MLGSTLGEELGKPDGDDEGSKVGSIDGDDDGSWLGLSDGELLFKDINEKEGSKVVSVSLGNVEKNE